MAEGEAKVKRKVPVKDNLFKLPSNGDPGYLKGSRCKACGEYFHPPRVICANCYSEDLEQIALSRRGKIYTYTIGRVGYPGTPVVAPFVTAIVELPEGVQIISLVTGLDPGQVKFGAEVELYFWKIIEDGEGNEWMAYAFRPVGT